MFWCSRNTQLRDINRGRQREPTSNYIPQPSDIAKAHNGGGTNMNIVYVRMCMPMCTYMYSIARSVTLKVAWKDKTRLFMSKATYVYYMRSARLLCEISFLLFVRSSIRSFVGSFAKRFPHFFSLWFRLLFLRLFMFMVCALLSQSVFWFERQSERNGRNSNVHMNECVVRESVIYKYDCFFCFSTYACILHICAQSANKVCMSTNKYD